MQSIAWPAGMQLPQPDSAGWRKPAPAKGDARELRVQHGVGHSKERSHPQHLGEHRGREQRSCELTAKAEATLHIVLGLSPPRGDVGSGMQTAVCLCVIVPLNTTPCHIQLLGTQPGALSPSFTVADCTRLLGGCARLCLALVIRTAFCSQPGTQAERPWVLLVL